MLATDLKKEYVKWISHNMEYETIENGIVRIDTPFLDNVSDEIILYAEKVAGNKNLIRITDDGWTVRNLSNYGFTIDKRSKKREKMLIQIASDFAVDYNTLTKEIYIDVSFDKFPIAKHRLLQAILRTNDLLFMRNDTNPSTFREDIEEKLNKYEIFHGRGTPIEGKRGFTIKFDFSIPSLNGKKEKYIQAISAPNNLDYTKIIAANITLLNYDTKAEFYAIYDDLSNDIARKSDINAVYEELNVPVTTLLFSEIDKNIDLLKNNK
ncbi:hypothetical protein BKP56_09065 [Marinilactibacillus sp. 15R]|uniref:DUF1828 domain-containing protein n=1 Tax=Marinilactibacillus sp. 15R TaxID=1911586 RepID=UPI00090A5DAD|nr:DUF1828 domain-containing protein [Marinilactibacillus sp. 15R]API89393.1 hypothetical protein BKP56_09065 [Marinilactibacillus sp. 15R]